MNPHDSLVHLQFMKSLSLHEIPLHMFRVIEKMNIFRSDIDRKAKGRYGKNQRYWHLIKEYFFLFSRKIKPAERNQKLHAKTTKNNKRERKYATHQPLFIS